MRLRSLRSHAGIWIPCKMLLVCCTDNLSCTISSYTYIYPTAQRGLCATAHLLLSIVSFHCTCAKIIYAAKFKTHFLLLIKKYALKEKTQGYLWYGDSVGILTGFFVGMRWGWGLKCNPHGRPELLSSFLAL